MKSAIRQIVGKTIASIVVSEENAAGPPTQLFLIFDDGTVYELYGDIFATGRLETGGEPAAIKYAAKFGGHITRFGKDENPASPPDLADPRPSHGPRPPPPLSIAALSRSAVAHTVRSSLSIDALNPRRRTYRGTSVLR